MGSGSPDQQTTTAEPWGPQGQELLKLFEGASQYLSQGAPETFKGPRVASQDPAQTQAQAGLLNNASVLDQQAQAANASNQQLLNASDVGNNPIVADAIQASLNPLARQFTNVVLPSLKLGGIDSGGSSSSRQGVLEANAANDFNQVSSDMIGKLMGQFYGQGLDAQTKGVALSPQVQSMVNAGSRNQALVGDARQSYQQQLINADVNKFYEDRDSGLNSLFNFRNLITGGFGGTTTSPGNQQPSSLGQLIGGGLSGFAATGTPFGAVAGGVATQL